MKPRSVALLLLVAVSVACADKKLKKGGPCEKAYPDYKPYTCVSTTPGKLMCLSEDEICDGLYYCKAGLDEIDCDYNDNYGNAGGACPAPDNTKIGDDAQAFQDQLVAAHNYFRCLHGSPPVTWSTAMQDKAQKAVDYSASLGILEHSNDGENLARIQISIADATGYGLVKGWYDEIKDYNYDNYKASTGIYGHFTQLLWVESTQVGCAHAIDIDGDTQLACEYDPPGNINTLDAFIANVKRPI